MLLVITGLITEFHASFLFVLGDRIIDCCLSSVFEARIESVVTTVDPILLLRGLLLDISSINVFCRPCLKLRRHDLLLTVQRHFILTCGHRGSFVDRAAIGTEIEAFLYRRAVSVNVISLCQCQLIFY